MMWVEILRDERNTLCDAWEGVEMMWFKIGRRRIGGDGLSWFEKEAA